MPDSKVSELATANALSGTELFYADDGAADVKVAASQIKTFILGSGSASVGSGKTLVVFNSGTLAGGDGFTLAIAAAKTLTISNTLTFAGTDGSLLDIGSGGTLGTAAYKNTGASGGNVPLMNGANTWGGQQTFSYSAGAPIVSQPQNGGSAFDMVGASTTLQFFLAANGNAQIGTNTNFNLDFYANFNYIVATIVSGSSLATTQFYVRSTQSASSTSTGALRCEGGVGIAGDIYGGGNLFCHPGGSVTPPNNGDLAIQASSNTSLTFKYKGSDGTVRSASLTLS